ncbi:MAG: hypothetical protein MR687_10430 [Spirochaetales bacterium]|nr:hypothetical protein [Spirochaetales bacterium]
MGVAVVSQISPTLLFISSLFIYQEKNVTSRVVSSLRAAIDISGVMFIASLIEEGEGILNQILDRNGEGKQIILSSC